MQSIRFIVKKSDTPYVPPESDDVNFEFISYVPPESDDIDFNF